MGKDVRRKCACGECQDFMRSDGVTCGYCGCLLTRRSKKDARYSSDSVGSTSGAGTSESTSPEKWKDEDLGRMSCKERSGKLCKFCEKDETTSAPLPTRRPYPDYGKLPNFHYLSWSATPTDGREPDDFQPRAQIKRLFEESELVSGDSEAIRRFSDKYIVPEKLVAEYVEHLAQIKMRKEKKKEETETGANGTAEPGVQ
ncbi:hypothetical protein AWC38_SpisGene3741 [Stylophora pistillata]|uniref:Uncharacterized protein n=1 Tax=Stylophora pistillata TaxID=50429 RepID=A0A2B4SSI2_STYPI|nr:hypothetical protein AWC38_SpisGene3741 [Stylophora pistillata]